MGLLTFETPQIVPLSEGVCESSLSVALGLHGSKRARIVSKLAKEHSERCPRFALQQMLQLLKPHAVAAFFVPKESKALCQSLESWQVPNVKENYELKVGKTWGKDFEQQLSK